MNSLFKDEHAHINAELLNTVDEGISEDAQIVFEGDATPVERSGKTRNFRRIAMIGVIVVAAAMSIAFFIRSKSGAVAPVTPTNELELAIAAAQIPQSAPAVITFPTPGAVPASDALAAQTVSVVENRPLLPSEPLLSAGAPNLAQATASHQAAPQLVLSIDKKASSEPAQPARSAPVKRQALSVKQTRPVEDNIIVARAKPTQSIPMRNLGIVAILTDGIIMRRGDDDVEVTLGDDMPGLGVLQKTNPRERTIETDQRIYKLN